MMNRSAYATRRNSAESVHELAQRCESLVALSPDAVLVNLENRIVFANPAAFKLFGASNETEVLGKSPLEFIHPQDHELVLNRVRLLLTIGDPVPRIEERVVRCDGEILTVEALAAVVPWEGKTAIQVILRDITDRKKWENQVRESENLFRQLADSMPQIVWVAAPDGRVDYLNHRFFEYTGLQEEDVRAGNLWEKVLHPGDVALAGERWRESLATGKSFEMQYRYKMQSTGDYRWHLGRAMPVRDESGEITRWIGTCTDIDYQKHTEIGLEQMRDQLSHSTELLEQLVAARTAKLQASMKSMEEFCHSIAHNLRAPLRAMRGFASALLEDHGMHLDEVGKDYSTRIDTAAGMMDVIIQDLLTYGHLNHQRVLFNVVDLDAIVSEVLAGFGTEIKTRRVAIRTAGLQCRIRTDASILALILTNLISNALKFSRPEVPPEIDISAQEDETGVWVRVRDNGIGVDAEHRHRIFRAFERLHTTEAFPGTGIGLALVAKGMERLGGRCGLESSLGHGSCFWIELPRRDRRAASKGPPDMDNAVPQLSLTF
jgi:PAS domain S-box-containing protein